MFDIGQDQNQHYLEARIRRLQRSWSKAGKDLEADFPDHRIVLAKHVDDLRYYRNDMIHDKWMQSFEQDQGTATTTSDTAEAERTTND